MSDMKSGLAEDLGDTYTDTNKPIEETVVGDFDENKMSGSEDQPNNADSAGKKRFQHIRKMVVNGFRVNRKEKTETEKAASPVVIGDTPNKGRDYNKSANKSSSSTLSRMWNSLFPNKESPDMPAMPPVDENNTKDRSSKTLGRFFSPRIAKESIERDIIRPKSSTLGRKISQSFRHIKIAASSPNVCEENPNPMSPTTSLEHDNATPTPV